jgi:hypothetical protein
MCFEKYCFKCQQTKSDELFAKDRSRKDGRQAMCKACRKAMREENSDKFAARDREHYQRNRKARIEKQKQYSHLHRDQIKAYQEKYREENKEQLLKQALDYYYANHEECKRRNRERARTHPEKRMAYHHKRYKTDIQYKLGKLLRNRLRNAIKGKWKSGSAVRDLGCTISEFITYLESQFQPGMSWDNWAMNGWHIDHKVPLANFDLADRTQLLEACHYTNLQPMWSEENWSKGARFISSRVGGHEAPFFD